MQYKEITITKKDVKTGKDEVLHHLKTKTITSKQANDLYGVSRLSAIIFCFREEGYNIISIPATIKTRYDKPANIAIYKYIEPVFKKS